MEATKTRHADRAKRWALLAIRLALAGAIIGAIVGFYSNRGKHEPTYETMRLVPLWSREPSDVPFDEVEKDLLDHGYKVANPTERIEGTAPDGQRGTIEAEELTEALRHGFHMTLRKVPVDVQRKIDLDKDQEQAFVGAGSFGAVLALIGLVPAAWYLLLVMLGQVAASVRRD
jgi:hypothetical protein